MAWDPQVYAVHGAFVPGLANAAFDLLGSAPGERILDLGCGDGVLTERIVAAGATVVGVDADPAMVAAAFDMIFKTGNDPASTNMRNAWPKRKSPTRTLAWLPQIMRAVLRPRLVPLSSTTSSCNSVAVCMNSTAAATRTCQEPG